MNIFKLIPFVIFTLHASVVSADVTHLEKGKVALIAMDYPSIFINTAKNACNLPEYRDVLATCKNLNNIPQHELIDTAAPYLIKYVSISNLDKIIAFWESDTGKDISNKLIMEQRIGRQDLLTASDLMILDKFNKTDENQAAMRFAGDVKASSEIFITIENLLRK